jgi:hypothetical protein
LERAELHARIARYVQEWRHREQLEALTGNADVDEFILAKRAEQAALLRELDQRLRDYIAALPPPSRLDRALAPFRRLYHSTRAAIRRRSFIGGAR